VTIAETLRRIQQGELILPAIQREYVWKPSQVIKLFDSIVRGYPVGSFLSWRVEPSTVRQFKFYGFMKDYSAFNKRHNPVLDVDPTRPVIAVLDGQQRLTSLNVGLRGTYAYRVKGGWTNKPWAYPERRLYLNLLGEAPDNEAGLRYHFAFLTKEQLEAADADDTKKWFTVSDIFEAREQYDLFQLLPKYGIGNSQMAMESIGKLWDAVHKNPSLQFYEEEDQDVERVLDIFIRVNSGGTVLSYSDLLLSIATAQWKTRDARAAVHGLVDRLNTTGMGFSFSQDTVLKSGLVLADVGDIGFKVKNFTASNMARLDDHWDDISDSLEVAAGLLSDFGLSAATLTADSVLIPVAYYVHHRRLKHDYRTAVRHRADRALLRSWVLRSLIVRGVWGSGLDTVLRDIRATIKSRGADGFPLADVEHAMALRGKSLAVTDALVEDVLNLRYGQPRTFAVLATIFDHVDTRDVHHVDHVFPSARLGKRALDAANAQRDEHARWSKDELDDLLQKRDQLPNLELLPGPENIGKSDKAPDDWARQEYPTPDAFGAFVERNALPSVLPHDADGFLGFFEDRRAMLVSRIKATMRTQTNEVQAEPDAAAVPDINDALAESDVEE
jgi:hypothetical protein